MTSRRPSPAVSVWLALIFVLTPLHVSAAFAQQVETGDFGWVVSDEWEHDPDEDGVPPVDPDTGEPVSPTYYTNRTARSDTQASCWRVSPGYDEGEAPVGDAERYATRQAAATAATSYEAPAPSGGGLLIGTDATEGVYRRQQMLPCVDEADPIQVALITPEQRALIGWQAWARPLAPAVLTEPTTYSVVGVPTLVSMADYQPDYDLDADARTITWAIPANIQLRATAAHRIRWNDEAEWAEDNFTDWLERNGRPFEENDSKQGFKDSDLIKHTYTIKGDKTIQVDVRWTGEWRIGDGLWEPLPADPIYLVESFPIEVREIQAVLTND